MKAHVQWTNAAFREVSSLPEKLAYRILKRSDYLRRFPLMGSSLQHRYRRVTLFRQLIVDGDWRIVYGYLEGDDTLYILAVQNCRQKLPTATELIRRRSEID